MSFHFGKRRPASCNLATTLVPMSAARGQVRVSLSSTVMTQILPRLYLTLWLSNFHISTQWANLSNHDMTLLELFQGQNRFLIYAHCCWLRQLSDRLAVFVLFRGEFLVCKISRNKPLKKVLFWESKTTLTLSNDWLHFLETKSSGNCGFLLSLWFLKTKLEMKSAVGLCTILLIDLWSNIVLL